MESLDVNNLFSGIYKNKRVLVTGHTGFKGSWLCIWLDMMGAKIIGYALDPYTERDNFVLAKVSEKIQDIRADVRDFDKLQKVFDQYQPEIVFHLAAQPLVRDSYDIPRDTYEINVMGTVNVLECVRKSNSVKACLVVTSDKCYENKEQVWGYKENDAMGGYDPYSSSKGCAELVVSAYRNSYFKKPDFDKGVPALASARAGNVIGGGDWSKDRLIPDCIRAFEKGNTVKIRNPEAVRPWQHVLESINGYLLLVSKLFENPQKYHGGWNFGPMPDSIVSVSTVTKIVADLYEDAKFEYAKSSDDPHEAKLLSLDISKAIHKLGWMPNLGIRKALDLTIEWYKNYSLVDVYDLCVKHIEYFLKKN